MKVDILPARVTNACGVCWLGPCMCHKMQVYGPPRPTRDQRTVPAGTDDHVWNKAPAAVRASTVAFVNAMRAEKIFGIEWRTDHKEGYVIGSEVKPQLIKPGDKEWYS